MTDITTRALSFESPLGPLTCLLREPERLCPAPFTFLCFFGDARESVDQVAARQVLEAGHRVLSFDPPCFGERSEDFGEGAEGLCAAFMAGEDPFLRFLSDAAAAVDALAPVSRGFFALGGHVGGYMALRLLAHESRILAAAALSPVVDFTVLDEWREVAGLRSVKELSLLRYAEGLSGHPLHLSVGNQDRRVGTREVCGLFCAVYDENLRRGYDNGLLDFHCSYPSCHAGLAAEFLLGLAAL